MIFISYRNTDTKAFVSRLDADLKQHFGDHFVFLDKSRIKAGQEWSIELEEQVRQCKIMLVAIGKTWDTVRGSDGYPRLDNPKDWVHKEVSMGLNNEYCKVIPILVDRPRLPKKDFLARVRLDKLLSIQSERIDSGEHYQSCLKKLIESIEFLLPEKTSTKPENDLLKFSYLKWVVSCHERLEFRGIDHQGGGSVSVELKQVYLALQADATSPLERAAERQNLALKIQEALKNAEIPEEDLQNVEWFVIAGSPIMSSIEFRNRINHLEPDDKVLLNLGEAYFNNAKLVVLGDPGSGKTTLARWLSLVSAQGVIDGKENLEVPLSQIDPNSEPGGDLFSLGLTRIPILIRVSEYAEFRQRASLSGKISLMDFLGQQSWLGNFPVWDDGCDDGRVINPTLLNEFFRQTLIDGNALLVLDGLDEIPASNLRDEVVEEVDKFLERWIKFILPVTNVDGEENPVGILLMNKTAALSGNRVLITSRIAGYHAAKLKGSSLSHVTIEPMSEKAVANFIRNWMLAVARELASDKTDNYKTEGDAEVEAEAFLEALRSPRQRGGRELATNPLLCGILATVFKRNQSHLPESRIELYDLAVNLLLDIWTKKQKNREDSKVLRYELFDLLQSLAVYIHTYDPTGLITETRLKQLALQFLAKSRKEDPFRPSATLRASVEEIIRIVKQDVGILAARGEGVYGFLHLTFQEYFAGRSVVNNRNEAVGEIIGHLGDPRWREALRLGLGYLSVVNPESLVELISEAIHQETPLGDLLPQAALMTIGSLPDIQSNQKAIVKMVANVLLESYYQNMGSDEIDKRNGLLESAIQRLIDMGYASEIEDLMVDFLYAPQLESNKSSAFCKLLIYLDFFPPKIINALLRISSNTDVSLLHSITKVQRIAITESEDGGPLNKLFANVEVDKSAVMSVMAKDMDWFRLIIAFYGGVGDYNVSENIALYYRTVGFFLQQYRSLDLYGCVFAENWSVNLNEDFAFKIASTLDGQGNIIFGKLESKPQLDVKKIYKHPRIDHQLLQVIAQRQAPGALLAIIENDRLNFQSEFILAKWLLDGISPGETFKQELLQNQLLKLRDEIEDAVCRTGPQLYKMIADAASYLSADHIWPLFEASVITLFDKGISPHMHNLSELKDLLPRHLRPYLLAELLTTCGQGWAFNDVTDKVIFDLEAFSAEELLFAQTILPIAVHQKSDYEIWDWPINYLPQTTFIINDIAPSAWENLILFPQKVGREVKQQFFSMLKPIIDSNTELLPELFICGVIGLDSVGVNKLFELFNSPLESIDDLPGQLFEQVKTLTDPYLRARALFRLSEIMPDFKLELTNEANNLIDQIGNPLKEIALLDMVVYYNRGMIDESWWEKVSLTIEQVSEPDERARAWCRFGVYVPSEYKNFFFKKAFIAVIEIQDELSRGNTLRLIRKSVNTEHLCEAYFSALDSFQDPILKARAAEKWGTVFRLLNNRINANDNFKEAWAVLSTTAYINEFTNVGQLDSEMLWKQLAEKFDLPSTKKLIAHRDKSVLRITPFVLPYLRKFLDHADDESIESLFSHLKLSSKEALPFLRLQLYSSSNVTRNIAALMLVEKLGFDAETTSVLSGCFFSDSDLIRNRITGLFQGEHYNTIKPRTSIIGLQTVELLLKLRLEAPGHLVIHNSVWWIFEKVQFDSPAQISIWAEKLKSNSADEVARLGLRVIKYIEPTSYRQLLYELKNGDHHVREAILYSLPHIAKYNPLYDQTELLKVLDEIDPFDLGKIMRMKFNSEQLCDEIEIFLEQHVDVELNEAIIRNFQAQLSEKFSFTWKDIREISDPIKLFNLLEEISQFTHASSGIERERWNINKNIVQKRLETPGFMTVLCQLFELIFKENPGTVNPDFYIEKAFVIELLASSATLAPTLFLRSVRQEKAEKLLVDVILHETTYVSRCDALRLLGFLRTLSLDMLPGIYAALKDVIRVREAAVESLNYYRKLDPGVLSELKKWLADKSGIVAFTAARLLTVIARHSQNTANTSMGNMGLSLNTEITEALVSAIQTTPGDQKLYFGVSTYLSGKTPSLRGFFYDCMLKVAGFEEIGGNDYFRIKQNKQSKLSSGNSRPNYLDFVISQRGHLIHKLKAKDTTGRWAYYFVLVSPLREYSFLKSIEGDGTIDLEDYGSVIASCYGEEPTQEVKKYLKEKYKFDI